MAGEGCVDGAGVDDAGDTIADWVGCAFCCGGGADAEVGTGVAM